MTTRAEHIAWAKSRALEFLDAGELTEAVASMSSDVTKHPDIRGLEPAQLADGLTAAAHHDAAAVRRWIDAW